jgi:MSHA biogenesis protein MshN
MSLVNKMLRDLDARAPQAANDNVVPSLVAAAPRRVSAGMRSWIAPVAGVVVVGIAIGVWRWWPVAGPAKVETSALAGPVSQPVRPTAAAARKTPAPVAGTPKANTHTAEAETIAIVPQQVDRFDAAVAALRDGDPARAERLFRELLSGRPGHLRARELLAGLYVETGRLTEATALLDRGLKLAPRNPGLSVLLSRLLTEQGEETRAAAILGEALTTHPSDAELNALAAALDTRAGHNEQAVLHYRAALAARPGDGRLWLGLGIALEATGEQRDARDAYQRAQLSGLDPAPQRYALGRIAALTAN